jgi:catechol 2,3-dioxygenase-like lactoylglutathione lyase family enzyme
LRIDHINIAAPKALLEDVKIFYCEALELEDGPRPDFGIPGHWLYGGGVPIVHLIESDNHGKAEQPYYLDHVAFVTTGLESYVGRLKAMDIEYGVLNLEGSGMSQVFCKDPCGIGVEANFHGETLES